MRKKASLGVICLILGFVLVGLGFGRKMTVSADSMSDSTVQAISITLFVGIALILLSAILFIRAGSTTGKKS